MTIKAAMWVHGTAVAVEYPERLVPNGAVRKGGGTHFYGHSGSENWFHIAIPSPVILDGVQPKLARVFVLYRLGPGASGRLMSVHLWDGANRIRTWDDLKWQGDHAGALDGQNTWRLTSPVTIRFGLNIAVKVEYATLFDVNDTGSDRIFDFFVATAGADFTVGE